MAANSRYITKSVSFGGKKITLYSLDGDTWSSRSDELDLIKERHEQEKASYSGQIKGGPQARIPTTRPKATSVTAGYSRALREENIATPELAKVRVGATPSTLTSRAQKVPDLKASQGQLSKVKTGKPVAQVKGAANKLGRAKEKASLPPKSSSKKAAVIKKLVPPKARASGKPAKAVRAKGEGKKRAAR